MTPPLPLLPAACPCCAAPLLLASPVSPRARCGACRGWVRWEAGRLEKESEIKMTDQAELLPFWGRVECDARLWRKLSRRKENHYRISGQGERQIEGGTLAHLPVLIMVAYLLAPSRDLAISQLLADCPGAIVTFCDPMKQPATLSRFPDMEPVLARVPLASAEELARVARQQAQIKAHSDAHDAWMAGNRRTGRTDDEGSARMHRDFPWPHVRPAYVVPK